MGVIHHFYHECALTSSKIVTNGICNLCFKDKPIGFSCNSCNFDLCQVCSKLPQKVLHDFHPDHPLVFCLGEKDRKPKHVVCSGCGNMCSGSFYECKECNIYLDPRCATEANIFRAWDTKELLHDSHCHLLQKCKPGENAKGSCLICELPLSPSAICYGCAYCYWFVHERCVDLPTEIQHPVHSAHPLKRRDYRRTLGGNTYCDACRLPFEGAPFSCVKCDIDLHLRCADSLLRGLMHESHEHGLFYVSTNASKVFGEENPCHICMETDVISLDSYYHCVECGLKFHFECLKIPESVFKKCCHLHPLVCKVFMLEDDSLEYCGVCETMVRKGHHIYSCQECDFVGHIECILRREEVPSPLYLKDLYSCNKNIKKPTQRRGRETNQVKNKILINNAMNHIHVMRLVDMSDLDYEMFDGDNVCLICYGMIHDNPFKCKTCNFQTHHFCAELGKPSTQKGIHREHPNHSLTLLPLPPAGANTTCDICMKKVSSFSLFCRICGFIIHMSCVLENEHFRGALHRGQKVIGIAEGKCRKEWHRLFHVLVSSSYPTACTICDESLYEKVLSCMECGEIYHPQCIEAATDELELVGHPLHPFHDLKISLLTGSMCLACKNSIDKYGYHCGNDCEVSFHTKCVRAVNVSENILKRKFWEHNLYNFWIDSSKVSIACSVCGTPCGASFYGCICCNFSAHVECLGFPRYVRNQLHQHHLFENFSSRVDNCSLCGSKCFCLIYSCTHCSEVFHRECIISMDERKPATEEEQLKEIYLMYLEHSLYDLRSRHL